MRVPATPLPTRLLNSTTACRDCKFFVNGRIITGHVELWSSSDVVLEMGALLGTLQADQCSGVRLHYATLAFMGSVVFSGVTGLLAHFGAPSTARRRLCLNLLLVSRRTARSRAIMPSYSVPAFSGDHDGGAPQDLCASLSAADAADDEAQFITRWVGGGLLTEKIVRDAKEYPTTRRELEDEVITQPTAPRARRTGWQTGTAPPRLVSRTARIPPSGGNCALSLAALSRNARTLTPQGRAHELEDEAVQKRADLKREEGNEAFKDGNWAQAVCHHPTEHTHPRPRRRAIPPPHVAVMLRGCPWLLSRSAVRRRCIILRRSRFGHRQPSTQTARLRSSSSESTRRQGRERALGWGD